MSYGGGYGGNSVPPIAPQQSGRNGNRPSRNALRNTINVYRLLPTRDEDGAIVGNTWTLIYSNLPSLVTPGDSGREFTQAAVREVTDYKVMLGVNPGLMLGDKVEWCDDLGKIRHIAVVGMRSLAGRGAAFYLYGNEVI